MIIKTLSRKSNTGQLFKYVFRYVFREKDATNTKNIESNKDKLIIRHNLRSRSLNGFIKEYNQNESYRLVHRKDSVMLFHTVISFSDKDKEHINDKLLKEIAQKFIKERGTNNLYAIAKHEDKNHIHLHAIISGTQLNGRSSRISKQKLHSIKLALQKYQLEKFPQLVNSLPKHGKKQERANIIRHAKNERQTNKQALVESLERIYSKSKSQEQFITQLQKAGHEPYFRNGNFQGVKIGELKFRASRLGITKERLQELDKLKAKEEKNLNELRHIRASKDKVINRPILKNEKDIKTKGKDEKLTTELSSLRSKDDDEKEIGGGDTADPTDSIAPASDAFESQDQETDQTNQTNDEENNNDDEQNDDDNDTTDME